MTPTAPVGSAAPYRQGRGGGARRWALVALAVAVLGTVGVVGGCGRDRRPESRGPSAAPSGPHQARPSGTSTGQRTGSPSPSRQPSTSASTSASTSPGTVNPTSLVYQLQNYPHGRLDALADSPHQLAVIDLARDAHADFFTAQEIAKLRGRGKRVLAYFEIGSIENFRPEFSAMRGTDLMLNTWDEWPEERFVRYWDERWWQRVIKTRLDQALRAGFDGVYLDTPLAYEEIDLKLVPGRTRDELARAMGKLIVRISQYAKQRRPGFWVVPQNSPELRRQPGYLGAIDGLGMEELFYQATDKPCRADYCASNLAEARAVRRAGKFVLAIDYATDPTLVADACSRSRREGFVGYAAVLALDRISPPCG